MSRDKGPRAGGRKKKSKKSPKDSKALKKLRRPKRVPTAPSRQQQPQRQTLDYPPPPAVAAPAPIAPTPPPPPTVVVPRPALPTVVDPPLTGGDGTRSDSPGSIVNNSYHFDPHFHFDPRLNVGINTSFNPSILGGIGNSGGGGTSIGWNWSPWSDHPAAPAVLETPRIWEIESDGSTPNLPDGPSIEELQNRMADLRGDVALDRYNDAVGGLRKANDRLEGGGGGSAPSFDERASNLNSRLTNLNDQYDRIEAGMRRMRGMMR